MICTVEGTIRNVPCRRSTTVMTALVKFKVEISKNIMLYSSSWTVQLSVFKTDCTLNDLQ